MDLDKFRDLLRAEAAMRVRITGELGGEDFADAIREECNLRLGLYEGWLQTLDKGIGEPLVPSRLERGIVPPRRSEDEEKPPSTKSRRSTRKP